LNGLLGRVSSARIADALTGENLQAAAVRLLGRFIIGRKTFKGKENGNLYQDRK
jgi:FAD synthase